MDKATFDFKVLQMVLEMANDAFYSKDCDGNFNNCNFNYCVETLDGFARTNGRDTTDLLLALAPAVEQCRNGLNPFCELYAQRLTVAVVSAYF